MGIVEDVITDLGKVIISIIWGLGLATLFRKVCKGRKMSDYKRP